MLYSSQIFSIITLLASAITAAPTSCGIREQRKSWRTLTNSEKSAYLKAEKCLMKAPAKLGVPGAVTRWDELQYSHIQLSNVVHDVGAFLPWHRYYVYVHSQLLRSECSYKGPLPYWDEIQDISNITASPVFDSVYGLGGSGRPSDNCVVEGPFANLTLHLGPAYQISNYCLKRRHNIPVMAQGNQANLDACFTQTTFEGFTFCLEANPQVAGHVALGGLQLDVIASPGDPVFFFHHAYIDLLWWRWQSQNLTTRLTEIGGRNTPSPAYFARFPALAPVPASWYEIDGDPANVTTLNHVLGSANLLADATIKDVMNIQGGFLCYEYV